MLQADFVPLSARRISGDFNPAIVRVERQALGPLPGFYDPPLVDNLLRTTARQALHTLCRLSKRELRDLNTFSVCVDMKRPVGVDPLRVIPSTQARTLNRLEDDTPLDAETGENTALPLPVTQTFGFPALASAFSPFRLFGVMEDPGNDELEMLVATQIWARFQRVQDAREKNSIPKFTLQCACPCAQSLPAFTAGEPAPHPEEGAVLMGTPLQIRLIRDTLFGTAPSATFSKAGVRIPLLARPTAWSFTRQKHPRPVPVPTPTTPSPASPFHLTLTG